MLPEITMKDVFERPEWVNSVKEAKEIVERLDILMDNYIETNMGLAKSLHIDVNTLDKIRRNRVLVEEMYYVPVHLQFDTRKGNTFMGLEITTIYWTNKEIFKLM